MKFNFVGENFETLDFSILKCYKRVKKISVSKFKIQKNDKSNTYSVQFWCGKYGDAAVILKNLPQLIGTLFLSDSVPILR